MHRDDVQRASTLIAHGVVDDALSPDCPQGLELEAFIRRRDAERFVEDGRGTIPSSRRAW